VSVSGNSTIIGAIFDDDQGSDSGSVYVYTRSGTLWSEEGKLGASDGAVNDQFGGSVMLDGDSAAVGAWADDDSGSESGSAYVFIRTGTAWTQEDKLIASDGQYEHQFGTGVALEENTILVGSPGYEYFTGAVYEFTKESVNQPPVAEFSWAPQDPIVNQSIVFDASASQDPDGTIVLYEWDWENDGVFDESSESPGATHRWTEMGSYPITVRVTDNEMATDSITKTLQVNGTVDLSVEISGGMKITVIIKNEGAAPAENISWQILLTGGLLRRINETVQGTSDIPAGGTLTLGKWMLFGFGPITITVRFNGTEVTVKGFLLLFFVIGLK
jgi:FG-GAP repeat/PKD domain